MEIYDKAIWHIDAGEDKNKVLNKFKVIFSFLKQKNMLSDEGLEILDIGIDSSVSLHERLLTTTGKDFIEQHYDSLINLSSKEIESKLNGYL